MTQPSSRREVIRSSVVSITFAALSLVAAITFRVTDAARWGQPFSMTSSAPRILVEGAVGYVAFGVLGLVVSLVGLRGGGRLARITLAVVVALLAVGAVLLFVLHN